ncbi:ABC transporter substrate-binding protein [Spiractinospora alimapuensis]|uniref:ABC transporter substrate-binding protein n=1 Tax=Spiractinospora alimapuensis TaxID=2820884 RepID=UPI001F194130|nr:ABC transporter substrate-binding protein [Spiractinospora alimapuensis]
MTTRNGLFGLAALGSAAVLVLTACVPGDGDGSGGGTSSGFEDCPDNPLECNTGEVQDGGEMTWIINDTVDTWGSFSPAGGTVYNVQMTQGILPYTGSYLPDGSTYEYNMDVLAAEPELVNDGSDGEAFQYKFELNPDAVWSRDGETFPITADDFTISWMMAMGDEGGQCSECASRAAESYTRMESVESEDDGSTVVVTLEEGELNAEWHNFFYQQAITPGVYPAFVAVQEGFLEGTPEEPELDDPDGVAEYFEWIDSTMPDFSGGPWMMVEGSELNEQIILEPNEDYWGEQPHLDTLIREFNDEEPSYAAAVTNGEIDGGNPTNYNEDVIQELEALDNVHVDVSGGSTWEQIQFNNDIVDDVELRRGILTAIDADEIVERNFGGAFPEGERQRNFLFPEESPYFEDLFTDSPMGTGDSDEALSILEDAGYELDGDILTLDGEQVGPFRLSATDKDTRQTSLQIVQGHLDEIGIETDIEVVEDLGATTSEGDFEIIQYGWSGSPDFQTNPSQYWHSDSGSNYGNLDSEAVDEAVLAVQASPDLDEAGELANEAQRLVVDEAYSLPLMYEPEYTFVRDEYANVRPNMFMSVRANYNSHEWGVVSE